MDTSQSTLPEVQPVQTIVAPGVSVTSLAVDKIGGHGQTPQAVKSVVRVLSSSSVRGSSRHVACLMGYEGIVSHVTCYLTCVVKGGGVNHE